MTYITSVKIEVMNSLANKVDKTKSPSSVFITMALDMSWRLAVVVLVPIVGGFKLDEKLKTTPALTILGFVLAMAGMALVMWRTLRVSNQAPVTTKKPSKGDK